MSTVTSGLLDSTFRMVREPAARRCRSTETLGVPILPGSPVTGPGLRPFSSRRRSVVSVHSSLTRCFPNEVPLHRHRNLTVPTIQTPACFRLCTPTHRASGPVTSSVPVPLALSVALDLRCLGLLERSSPGGAPPDRLSRTSLPGPSGLPLTTP